MRISIGGIFAKCVACGADDFRSPAVADPTSRTAMICVGCKARTEYEALMQQIGAQAVERAARKAGSEPQPV